MNFGSAGNIIVLLALATQACHSTLQDNPAFVFAPVPGGCNMEFDTEIAPYHKLTVTDSTVKVDIQPGASPKSKGIPVPCEANAVQHEMYRLFLPEQDFTSSTYFSSIVDVLTVQGIRANSRKIPSSATGSKMRRVYSAYPGTGSVYAALAITGNNTAAYVPAFTYACSPSNWMDTCQVLNSPFSKVLCAVILFLGFFTTFLGHRYFKTEMFLLGFLSGALLSYITVAIVGNYGPSGNIGISVFLGCILGLTWLGFWWLYAIPVFAILLATTTLGFFWSSIAYFSSPAGVGYLENDTNFWLIFILLIFFVPLALSVVPDSANIICCAILGSYSVVISIDHYVGSNLKYIIINIVRRATSPGFNVAVIHPPYQSKDICLTVFWIILAVAGIIFQLRLNRGRPPFPPGMSVPGTRNLPQSERTPLLVESRMPISASRSDDHIFESPKWYNRFFPCFKLY
ncbi:transmembrane 7 superfamily member 3-like isoform X3 [Athalia rosae]|uniref:transmembrane 7 superfamily member 3-like isoform X3 n=1 Tax=Athalia rosae TaxID=37344 RepID=UPI002034667A|nr:transmembrane 7 superfamily member 3-like isoform X3 [Athalia rosae]